MHIGDSSGDTAVAPVPAQGVEVRPGSGTGLWLPSRASLRALKLLVVYRGEQGDAWGWPRTALRSGPLASFA